MKAVILGATRGMGRAVARQLVESGSSVFVLGLDDGELPRTVADLRERGGGASGEVLVGSHPCDLEQPDSFAPALAAAHEFLGAFDTVIVTAGLFRVQEAAASDLEFTRRMLTVNYAHTVLFCEHARTRLLDNGGGTLVAFSSVAGDRGRKPVILYGSSKAGLSHYLESLDHRYRSEGLVTLCVKPGFVKTAMTEGLPVPPFAGTPEQVANDVIRAIEAKKAVLYTPFMWRWVMLVIRNLPRFVMRKIGF